MPSKSAKYRIRAKREGEYLTDYLAGFKSPRAILDHFMKEILPICGDYVFSLEKIQDGHQVEVVRVFTKDQLTRLRVA